MGNFFAYLVKLKKPSTIVEVGTAFGVSGMYWLSGLESNDHGRLVTFEPNRIWAEIARRNLSAIGKRFQLVIGTFEENLDSYLGGEDKIDIAFIDAIHTSEWVVPQFNLVAERLASGGLILFDDINFSSDMASCWSSIAHEHRVKASVVLSKHVGLVECR
jgi:predicted O-methyltransferase YrrM